MRYLRKVPCVNFHGFMCDVQRTDIHFMSKLQDGELGRKTREAVKEKRRMTTNYQNRQHGQHQQYQQSQCCRINTIDSRFYHVKKTKIGIEVPLPILTDQARVFYIRNVNINILWMYLKITMIKRNHSHLLDLKSLCADQKKADQSPSLICREEKSI